MNPKQKAKADVWMWLAEHRDQVAISPMPRLILSAKVGAGAWILSEFEISSTIWDWAITNDVKLSTFTPDDEPGTDPIIAAIQQQVKTTQEKPVITRDKSGVSIGLSGLTGKLVSGNSSVGLNLSWTGTLKLETAKGDLHFAAEIFSDTWRMTLSFGTDTAIPMASALGKIFGEGEKALVPIAKRLDGFKNLKDIPRLKTELTPHLRRVTEAVEAAQGIMNAPKSKPGVSLQIGSPRPGPGETGIPGGIQGQIVITWPF